MQLNDLLTAQDVADYAGMKYKHLWTYQKRGTLPAADMYLGNKPLWKRETIEAWNSTRRVHKKPLDSTGTEEA